MGALRARISLVPLPRNSTVSNPKHPPASEPAVAPGGCFEDTKAAEGALGMALNYSIIYQQPNVEKAAGAALP